MLIDSDQPNAALLSGAGSTLRGRLAPRLALVRVPLLVFVAVVVLYALQSPAIYAAMNLWAVYPPVDYPFLDLQFVFAGAECWAKGVDVYLANPCDVLNRVHTYSPLWLRFDLIPQSWTVALGLLLDLSFVLSLIAFPPPCKSRELLVLLLAVLSPPVIFALQRANVDVLMYLLALAAAALWTRSLAQRGWAYAILIVAGLLKYYPLVALALAVRERTKIFLAICAITAAVLVAFVAYFHAELRESAGNIPGGDYLMGDVFGTKNLGSGLALLLGLPEAGLFAALVSAAAATLCAIGVIAVSRWTALQSALTRLAPFDAAVLLFGAVIVGGCFFAGPNVGYRGVFLVLPLPGLLALWRGAADERVRRFARLLTLLVLFVMWQAALTWNDRLYNLLGSILGADPGKAVWSVVWFLRELGWWVVAGSFVGLVAGYVRESPALGWLFAGRRAGAEKL